MPVTVQYMLDEPSLNDAIVAFSTHRLRAAHSTRVVKLASAPETTQDFSLSTNSLDLAAIETFSGGGALAFHEFYSQASGAERSITIGANPYRAGIPTFDKTNCRLVYDGTDDYGPGSQTLFNSAEVLAATGATFLAAGKFSGSTNLGGFASNSYHQFDSVPKFSLLSSATDTAFRTVTWDGSAAFAAAVTGQRSGLTYGDATTGAVVGVGWRDSDTVKIRLLEWLGSGNPQSELTATSATGLDYTPELELSRSAGFHADNTAIAGEHTVGVAWGRQLSATERHLAAQWGRALSRGPALRLDLTNTPTDEPAISGTPEIDETLTCDPGDWLGNPSFTYQWKRWNGVSATTIGGATSSTYVVDVADEGEQLFCTVTATGVAGTTAGTADSDYTAVIGSNAVPVAAAGSDIVVTLPVNTATLDGSGSTDSDGIIVSYAWTKVSGQACTIASPSSASTLVTFNRAGVYVFRLTVTDNESATDTDDVQVKVIHNIPSYASFELKMTTDGATWGEYQNPAGPNTFDQRLTNQYYDSQWVMLQIGDYVGETTPWTTYAGYAKDTYRDEYLIPNSWGASGFRRFSEGLYEDYARGGDTTQAMMGLIRDNPAFSTQAGYSGQGAWEELSREVAYALVANIDAEKSGLSRVVDSGTPRPQWLVEYAASHLREWRTKTFASTTDPAIARVAPFMVGITAWALIKFYEWEVANSRNPNAYWPTTHWPTIQAALKDVLTWMQSTATIVDGDSSGLGGTRLWVVTGTNRATFRYQDRTNTTGDTTLSPDLNQLISPAYYWLYKQTGENYFRMVGDQLFAAGADAGIAGGKQFNQLYKYAFTGLDWRYQGFGVSGDDESIARMGVAQMGVASMGVARGGIISR